jgi:hypothetical protein
VLVAAATVLLATSGTPVLAQQGAPQGAAAGAEPIVASLNPPPYGLSCDAAASATSVYFQFANPPFQIAQVSLYLDGRGVPQDAVQEQWPTVTLVKGLHPGSNTIDVVASSASGQQIQRRMLVQVGGAPSSPADTSGSAQVPCTDGAAPATATAGPYASGEYPYPAPATVDASPELMDQPPLLAVEDMPQEYYDTQYQPPQPLYGYAPAYVYNAYPLVALGPWVPIVPFFGFGFFFSHYHPHFAPPRVVVGNAYGHGGWGGNWSGNWHGGAGGFASGHYIAPSRDAGWRGAAAVPLYHVPAQPYRGYAPPPAARGYAPPAAARAAYQPPRYQAPTYQAPHYAAGPSFRPAAPSGGFHGAPSGGGGHGAVHGGGGHHH